MKKDDIAEARHQEKLIAVQILPATTAAEEWMLLFEEHTGHSYFLVSEDNEIHIFNNVEEALDVLRELDFHRAEITF